MTVLVTDVEMAAGRRLPLERSREAGEKNQSFHWQLVSAGAGTELLSSIVPLSVTTYSGWARTCCPSKWRGSPVCPSKREDGRSRAARRSSDVATCPWSDSSHSTFTANHE